MLLVLSALRWAPDDVMQLTSETSWRHPPLVLATRATRNSWILLILLGAFWRRPRRAHAWCTHPSRQKACARRGGIARAAAMLGLSVTTQPELSPTDWVREQTERILAQGTTDGVEVLDRAVVL